MNYNITKIRKQLTVYAEHQQKNQKLKSIWQNNTDMKSMWGGVAVGSLALFLMLFVCNPKNEGLITGFHFIHIGSFVLFLFCFIVYLRYATTSKQCPVVDLKVPISDLEKFVNDLEHVLLEKHPKKGVEILQSQHLTNPKLQLWKAELQGQLREITDVVACLQQNMYAENSRYRTLKSILISRCILPLK